jgi:hypothetical protein
MGRLKARILPHGLRDSEVRWIGKQIQWVISPVQIALWTAMDQSMPRNRLQIAPLRRWPS